MFDCCSVGGSLALLSLVLLTTALVTVTGGLWLQRRGKDARASRLKPSTTPLRQRPRGGTPLSSLLDADSMYSVMHCLRPHDRRSLGACASKLQRILHERFLVHAQEHERFYFHQNSEFAP